MWPFKRRIKQIPRELDLQFEGTVKRIQFSVPAGFKMTVEQNGKETVWWVPNDLGNRHCNFIREWMISGGFPEDPDYPRLPTTLGVLNSTWLNIGKALVGLATVAAALVGIATLFGFKL